MNKVIENTGQRLTVETNDSLYRLTFIKRYATETNRWGRERYYFCGWQLIPYQRRGLEWKMRPQHHVPEIYRDKAEVIKFIQSRPNLTEAAQELAKKR